MAEPYGNSRYCQIFNFEKEEQINYGWFFVSVAVAMAVGIFLCHFYGRRFSNSAPSRLCGIGFTGIAGEVEI